jgi:glyceraldehyde 3-phosphate dehydrogenase
LVNYIYSGRAKAMSINVGINGFGRIGRNFYRGLQEHGDINVVAINDLTDPATLAHLLKYDSVHGRFPGTVEAREESIVVNGKEVRVLATKDPAELPWKELGVDYVIESTGHFTSRAGASKHLEAGAKKVLISAPAKEPDLTVVMGVNHESYDPAEHHIVSNASCTTNCLAPVAKVLQDNFGIHRAQMTTIHSYTNDQRILDFPHKDLRRARAAAVSMIPTTTGAARAVALVIPELKGKIDGMAVRVPTVNVSVVDLTAEMEKDVTEQEVNDALKEAARGSMQGVLDFTDEPVVSVDMNGYSCSSVVDGALTKVLDKRLLKVLSWYDNEMAYSCRLRDLVQYMHKKGA